MKFKITSIFLATMLSLSFCCLAQTDPLAEIQGDLSIHATVDTSSIHIGRKAGTHQTLGTKLNTFVGDGAGFSNEGGFYNSFFGGNAGRDTRTQVLSMFEASQNSFFGALAGKHNQYGSSNSFFGALAGFNNIGRSILNVPDGEGNSFFGALCGRNNESGSHNSFLGTRAGMDNKESDNNSFFGYESGKNNYGLIENPETMQNDVYGSNNSFFGHQSGYLNETGQRNTFIGQQAGYSNIGGDLVDFGEGYSFTNGGSFNTFIGSQAGYSNEAGRENVYIGNRAGADNASGNYNVMIGAFSGTKVSGNYNVFLGAGPNIPPGVVDSMVNNRLYIGDSESITPLIYGEFDTRKVGINTVSPEMTLTIGGEGNESRLLLANAGDIFFKNSAGTNKAILTLHSDDDTYLDAFDDLKFRSGHNLSQADPNMILQSDGDVGIGVSDPSYKLHVDGTVRGTDIVCTSTSLCSDIRFKKGFVPLKDAIEKIKQLQGYKHQWRIHEFPDWKFPQGHTMGFIAQDLQKVVPEVVQMMGDGFLAVDYAKVVPLLVEAIKEQQTIIEIQQQQLDRIIKILGSSPTTLLEENP